MCVMRALIFLAAAAAAAQPAKVHKLAATPQTVVWGHYAANTPPALKIHSGDTLEITTLITNSPARLEARAFRRTRSSRLPPPFSVSSRPAPCRLMRVTPPLLSLPAAAAAAAQPAKVHKLAATPQTVVWGHYAANTPPAL